MAHELGKDAVSDAVEHPWESVLELPGIAAEVLGRSDPIKPIYDKAGRSMLILGQPGSGKTITRLRCSRAVTMAAQSLPRGRSIMSKRPNRTVLSLTVASSRWMANSLSDCGSRFGSPLKSISVSRYS